MVYGGLPWLWSLSGEAVTALGYDAGNNEILQTVAFVAMGNVVSTILGLPWSAYFTFKVEQKHGFNKQVCVMSYLHSKFKRLEKKFHCAYLVA